MSIFTTHLRGLRRTAIVAASMTLLLGASAVQAQATTGAGGGYPTPHGVKTLHISPTGSDHNSGSASSPLKTPQVAVDRLGSAGGIVVFAGGRYAKERVDLFNRSHITLEAAPGATPVLDGKGLTPPDDDSGMVDIRDSSNITVEGLTITGYRTKSIAKVPIGIYVTGYGDAITLRDNHIHDLGNDNPTLGSMDMNAHGIAVYGRDATRPISNVNIVGNQLDHLVLGASESLVLNGNVDGWAITDNLIYDNNNIGIDAIGFEPTISGAARYTGVNQARNGIIARNTVSRIISEGNPAYWDDGWCNCADGIYVDGGRSIKIADNRVSLSDIGIEVASEWAKGSASDVQVTGNFVTGSRYVGLSLGGYDELRGQDFDVTVSHNTLIGNNTLNDGSPELLLQYYIHDTTITDNYIESTKSSAPVMLFRDAPAGSAAENAHLVLNNNRYVGRVPAGQELYQWNAVTQQGLKAYRAASGEDKSSTYTKR
jgi:Right handed beta helix region